MGGEGEECEWSSFVSCRRKHSCWVLAARYMFQLWTELTTVMSKV